MLDHAKITLFDHQRLGAGFLAEREVAGLFFGMGTGKTITSLEALRLVSADRVVVVAPPIALPMWQREASSWLSTPATLLKTGKTPLPAEGVVVVSYAIATARAQELGDWLAAGSQSAVVFDESHALKSPDAKRTKALLGKGGMTDGTVDYQWHLTGTPITKWNDDLYPFLLRADPEGMRQRCGGTRVERFRRKFCIQQQRTFARKRTWLTVGNRNTTQLAEWLYGEGHALRVDLDEVFKSMPPITINAYTIDLDTAAISDEARGHLDEIERASLSEIQRRQEAGDPALATLRRELGLGKVKSAASEIIARIDSGQSVLVGAWHTDVIDAMSDILSGSGKRVRVIDGRCASKDKQATEAMWNAGELDALICNIAAAGVSLNLQQGGSQIVVAEEDWSPTIMDQFYARLWRYGQKKHVHVDILRSDTKLDQALARISTAKAAQAEKHNTIGRAHTEDFKEETTQ